MSQARYVYLMRVRLPWSDRRRWSLLLNGRELIKIGVAVDVERRRADIDRSHEARVRVLDRYYCEQATKHEARLHKMFKARSYQLRMDGGTEVFALSSTERRRAQQYLTGVVTVQTRFKRLWWALFAALLVVCAYAVRHWIEH